MCCLALLRFFITLACAWGLARWKSLSNIRFYIKLCYLSVPGIRQRSAIQSTRGCPTLTLSPFRYLPRASSRCTQIRLIFWLRDLIWQTWSQNSSPCLYVCRSHRHRRSHPRLNPCPLRWWNEYFLWCPSRVDTNCFNRCIIIWVLGIGWRLEFNFWGLLQSWCLPSWWVSFQRERRVAPIFDWRSA